MRRAAAIFLVEMLLAGLSAVRASDDLSILLGRAESFSAHGDHRAAAETFAKALESAPGQESLRFRMAAEHVYAGELDTAEGHFLSLASSPNPAIAVLAKNSLDAIAAERRRVAGEEARQAEYERRAAAQKLAQAARERAFRAREADLAARQAIYDHFAAGQDAEGLMSLDGYAQGRVLPPELVYEGVFALQRMGRLREAAARLEAMPEAVKATPGWLLVHGRIQRALGRNAAAWESFSAARAAAAGLPEESTAISREIQALPAEANLDRWTWGELQLDGLYMTRFWDAIAYGRIRQGTFVPGARWIQPFLEAGFTLDTKSGLAGGLSQVYANNLAGFHVGARIRLVPNEDIWVYAMVGAEKDLRGTTRFDGAWFLDWRAGFRGYKGIGPGINFLAEATLLEPSGPRWALHPRLAWFAEGGWDAAYYSLYENFIAYGALREGFRLLEVGGWIGLDAYALQQGTADSQGLYYNNFIEFGGGLRATARIDRGIRIVTRAEYLGGIYSGREADNSRGTLPASYADLRITISLWCEW